MASDRRNLFVLEAGGTATSTIRVGRRDIVEIDHPGSVAAPTFTAIGAAGLLTTMISGLVLLQGLGANESNLDQFATAGIGLVAGIAILVPSAIGAIWGWIVSSRSKSAAGG